MAAIFREEFGDMLLTEPIPVATETSCDNVEDDNNLPSPEQLRGKIILKVSSETHVVPSCLIR